MCALAFVRVNVTLADDDLAYLDDLAGRTGRSRSELIREAIRAYRPPVDGAAGKERPDRDTVRRWLETVRIELPADSTEMLRAMREGRSPR